MSEKLNQESVFDAAHRITLSGEKPTMIKIHRLLGRGSYSTISKYLKLYFESDAWIEASQNKELPEELNLPNSAREAMELALKTIWQAAESSAQEVLDVRTKAVTAQLEDQEKEIEQVINTNAQQSSQLEANQSEIRRLGNELDSANKSNGVLSEKINTLSSANTELKAEIENLKSQLRNQAQLEKDLEAANTTISNLNTEISNLSANNGKLEAQLNEKADSLQTATTDLKDALQKLSTAADDLEAAHKANTELTVKLTKSETSLEASSKSLEANTTELKEVKAQLSTANTQLNQATTEAAKLKVDLATAQTGLTAETEVNKTLTKQVQRLETKADERDLQVERLQKSLNIKVSEYLLQTAGEQSQA
ncbi:KfrA [Vibrio astriarenae]|nr:KfrA [Vibrio sp. C7]